MQESVVGTDSDCYVGKSFDVRSMERMHRGSRRGSSFTIMEVLITYSYKSAAAPEQRSLCFVAAHMYKEDDGYFP